jgi:hypothetical protein
MLSKTTREPAAAVLGLHQHTRVVALLHNHRSGGEPRQDINPWQQITDRLDRRSRRSGVQVKE